MKNKWKGRNSILLLIAAIVIVIGVTWAVFTYQANKKGVISTDAIDTNFASNYLKLHSYVDTIDNIGTDKYDGQTLLFGEGQETVSFDVTVQNYLVAGTNNSQSIDYTLTLLLEGAEYGTLSEYTLTNITNGTTGTPSPLFSAENKKWTSSQYTLQGGYDSIHTFRVTIPADALNKVELLMVAQPTTASLPYTNHKMLAVVFSPCTETNVKEFACTHQFTDQMIRNDILPSDLDAFNYEVSINTGKAWVTVTWDTEYVTIDPSFVKRVTLKNTTNPYTQDGTKKSLEFQMDTAEAGSSLIQFYRNKGKNETEAWQKSWAAMEDVISSSAVQITEE